MCHLRGGRKTENGDDKPLVYSKSEQKCTGEQWESGESCYIWPIVLFG